MLLHCYVVMCLHSYIQSKTSAWPDLPCTLRPTLQSDTLAVGCLRSRSLPRVQIIKTFHNNEHNMPMKHLSGSLQLHVCCLVARQKLQCKALYCEERCWNESCPYKYYKTTSTLLCRVQWRRTTKFVVTPSMIIITRQPTPLLSLPPTVKSLILQASFAALMLSTFPVILSAGQLFGTDLHDTW